MNKAEIVQAKAIMEEITNSENKKYNLSINHGAYTLIEYYNSELFKKNLSCSKTKKQYFAQFMKPLRLYGYQATLDNQLHIALIIRNKMYKAKDIALGTFHECRHCYQDTEENYIGLLSAIERCIVKYNNSIYQQYHDTFFVEIEANAYGYQNALDYLDKKQILSPKIKEFYQFEKIVNECYLDGYNPIYTFHLFGTILSKNISKFNYENSWLSDIYEPDGMMKFPEDILNNENFKNSDLITKYIIIAHSSFLGRLDMAIITEEDKRLIIGGIKYALDVIKRNREQNISKLNCYITRYLTIIPKIIKNIHYQRKNNDSFNKDYEEFINAILKKLNISIDELENTSKAK